MAKRKKLVYDKEDDVRKVKTLFDSYYEWLTEDTDEGMRLLTLSPSAQQSVLKAFIMLEEKKRSVFLLLGKDEESAGNAKGIKGLLSDKGFDF